MGRRDSVASPLPKVFELEGIKERRDMSISLLLSLRRSAARSSDYFFMRFRIRSSPSDDEELTAEGFLCSDPDCELLDGKYLHIYIPTSLNRLLKTVSSGIFSLTSLSTPLKILCQDPLLVVFVPNFEVLDKIVRLFFSPIFFDKISFQVADPLGHNLAHFEACSETEGLFLSKLLVGT